METRANFLLIGLFVLGVIASGFLFVYWLVRGTDTTTRREVVVIFPSSVPGLVAGASVTFNGIRIGEVTRLSFAPDDPNRVLAVAQVDATAPLREDTRAALGFQGLTGSASVQLEGGSAEKPNLFDGEDVPVIRADPSAIQDLVGGARRILNQAESVLGSLDQAVGQNRAAIDQTVANVRTFSDALAKNAPGVDQFLADVSRAAGVVGDLADEVGPLVKRVDELVAAIPTEDVTTIVKNAAKASNDLAAATTELDDTIKELRAVITAIDAKALGEGVEGFSAVGAALSKRAPEIDALLEKSASAASNLEKASKVFADRSGDIDQIVGDAKAITTELAKASKRVDGVLASIDGLVSSPDGQGLFASGRGFLEEATLTAKEFRAMASSFQTRAAEITASINRLSGTGLREVQGFVAEGRRTLQTLDRAVTEIERNPQQFLFGNNRVPTYSGGNRR
jgi:phospholipid/cholesterol/gamma-HCH transport system substrate-binding protein